MKLPSIQSPGTTSTDTFKNNLKLTCLISPMNDEYDFVDAPLVTPCVNGVVK